jgi:hypothetical protein
MIQLRSMIRFPIIPDSGSKWICQRSCLKASQGNLRAVLVAALFFNRRSLLLAD